MNAALRLSDANKIDSLLDIARTDPRIIVPLEYWDANPWLAGVENGVLDLLKGFHRRALRSDFITKSLGAAYDPGAKAPIWMRFLSEILPADVADYLQEVCGLALTGDTSEQCFWFLYGSGANGKSRFVDTLHSLLGSYGSRAAERLLAESDRGDVPEKELAMLPGVRLLIGTETKEGMRLREGTVKDLTGGDIVTGRFLYKMQFDFRPQLKLLMMGNHKPHITGTDGGIWRRVRLLEFPNVIPEERRDPRLGDKLRAELAGVLNWCLAGLARWRMRGKLLEPPEVKAAGQAYREDMDTLGAFIAENIQEGVPHCQTSVSEIYARYLRWAEDQGNRRPFNQNILTRRLNERPGWQRDRGRKHWLGLSLIPR